MFELELIMDILRELERNMYLQLDLVVTAGTGELFVDSVLACTSYLTRLSRRRQQVKPANELITKFIIIILLVTSAFITVRVHSLSSESLE